MNQLTKMIYYKLIQVKIDALNIAKVFINSLFML